MSVYQCADCGLHYCTDCDGGIDQCDECRRGPLCHDCAAENHTGMQHVRETRGCDNTTNCTCWRCTRTPALVTGK